MTISGEISFDPADRIYAEHFPGRPVVPGSLIMQGFINLAREAGFSPRALRRWRFVRFVEPGSYRYLIEASENRLSCQLLAEDEVLTTGVIRL